MVAAVVVVMEVGWVPLMDGLCRAAQVVLAEAAGERARGCRLPSFLPAEAVVGAAAGVVEAELGVSAEEGAARVVRAGLVGEAGQARRSSFRVPPGLADLEEVLDLEIQLF